MPEATQIVYKHKELVELLIRDRGLHEGIWGLFVRFGMGASNVGATEAELQPAAIIPVLEIGLQKFEKETNISVDAAKVNPKPNTKAIVSPARRH
jgi:hypothetical protein